LKRNLQNSSPHHNEVLSSNPSNKQQRASAHSRDHNIDFNVKQSHSVSKANQQQNNGHHKSKNPILGSNSTTAAGNIIIDSSGTASNSNIKSVLIAKTAQSTKATPGQKNLKQFNLGGNSTGGLGGELGAVAAVKTS